MKATIESTDVVTTVDGNAARVWKGVTEQGTPFVAFIARVAVEEPHDASEFEQLHHAAPPREFDPARVLSAFSLRML